VSGINPFSLLDRYRRLAEVSLDLASTLDLGILLNRIVRIASELCNAEAASILLYDEAKKQLYFESASNLTEPLMRGLSVPLENSIAGQMITNNKPIMISDANNDSRIFTGIAKATNIPTRSMLAVPMLTKGKPLGVLEAINKIDGQFTQEDQDILMALGAQAAVAIQNARLFQQSDFISEMIHELRTPLSSLSTAAHLLMRTNLQDQQHWRMANVVYTETNRLLELANSFLDLARLESGRIQFHPQVFDVRPLLDECVNLVRNQAVEQNLSIQVKISGRIPAFKADRDKIKQVVLNLLSNAIKYNRPSGGIIVSVEAELPNIIIAIHDTGIGMREEDQAHLFEKFFRVKATEGTTPGTGLGLAICKRIIEAHVGRIEVQSQFGVGTTINVILPVGINEDTINPPSVDD
jgi:signal transduction histidine kinase